MTDKLIADIDDLIHQATTENSHFYAAGVLKRAKGEIVQLREDVGNLVRAIAVRNHALERWENGDIG